MSETAAVGLAAAWFLFSLVSWVTEERGEQPPCRFTRLRCRPTARCELQWAEWTSLPACGMVSRAALPAGHPPVRVGNTDLCSAALAAAASGAHSWNILAACVLVVAAVAAYRMYARPAQAEAVDWDRWVAENTTRPNAGRAPVGWQPPRPDAAPAAADARTGNVGES